MRRLAIGDIHGCNKTFLKLLDTIGLNKDDELTLLGDYVDRGPDSKGVIDTIINLKSDGYNVRTLKGNHEEIMLNALNPDSHISVLENWALWAGGQATLNSFGDSIIEYVPFFNSLDIILHDESYIFVHAGLDFSDPNPFKDEHAFLWIRNYYPDINHRWLNGRIIVHGHTPISWKDIQIQFDQLLNDKLFSYPALNLDGGCVFKGGHLVAADLTNNKLYAQNRLDKV
ncbi:MAG: serine/threonine protein phosphatase [Saprospiraceae bacterium]|nr:serine/threonine protein phosphatase [Saprospiraceae bacterium]